MKAVTLNAFDTPPVLREDLPAPTPAPDEVLLRVHASSVNPVDNSIAAGMLKQIGVAYEFPVIIGRDYAGVVEQVGADVTGYSVGNEVFGFLVHAATRPSTRGPGAS
jgi:NADPH:quinone reductase